MEGEREGEKPPAPIWPPPSFAYTCRLNRFFLVMAAKEAIFELLKDCSLSKEELTENILTCVRQHKLGTVPIARYAKDVTGIRLESGAREETGRFRDVKRCVATEDRTRVSGISLLRHNRLMTAARYHRCAPQSF